MYKYIRERERGKEQGFLYTELLSRYCCILLLMVYMCGALDGLRRAMPEQLALARGFYAIIAWPNKVSSSFLVLYREIDRYIFFAPTGIIIIHIRECVSRVRWIKRVCGCTERKRTELHLYNI